MQDEMQLDERIKEKFRSIINIDSLTFHGFCFYISRGVGKLTEIIGLGMKNNA